MTGTRMISHVELEERLEKLKRAGVDVPELKYSTAIPKYVRNAGNLGIYKLGERFLVVKPGDIIDTFGNVVNISDLEAQAQATEERR